MNDNDDAGDVHPLDQDYSEVESREKRQFKLPEEGAAGRQHHFHLRFIFAVLTALFWEFLVGRERLRLVGYVHVVAMLMILVGGLLMLLGYRISLLGRGSLFCQLGPGLVEQGLSLS